MGEARRINKDITVRPISSLSSISTHTDLAPSTARSCTHHVLHEIAPEQLVGHVAHLNPMCDPLSRQAVEGLLESWQRASDENAGHAFFCEAPRYGCADAAGGTGDDGVFADWGRRRGRAGFRRGWVEEFRRPPAGLRKMADLPG